MSKQHSTEGGFAQIRKVVERMTALADWMEKYKPHATVLTLWRTDLQVICRHPKAAAQFQITVPAGGGPPTWRKFALMTAAAAGEKSSE
jgi:hypothetical protein